MKTIGYKLTALSPTRGASAELAASLTVVSASYMGLPVSTTSQAILGAFLAMNSKIFSSFTSRFQPLSASLELLLALVA